MNKYIAWFRTRLNRISLWWHAKQHRGETPIDSNISEIDALSEELYRKTAKKMEAAYQSWQKRHSQGTVSDEEARKFMFSLLNMVIAERKELTGMLEKSISSGSLFKRYYSRMQLINYFTNSAYTKMKIMQASKERYEYQRGIYRKVIAKAYIPDVKLHEGDRIFEVKHVMQDEWTEMDHAAGQFESEASDS